MKDRNKTDATWPSDIGCQGVAMKFFLGRGGRKCQWVISFSSERPLTRLNGSFTRVNLWVKFTSDNFSNSVAPKNCDIVIK